MEGKILLNNALQKSRYFNVQGHNVTQPIHCSFVFAVSSTLENAMALPYTELLDLLKKHFGVNVAENTELTSALQQYRNHLSALNGFLANCGKTVEANVGAEFGSQFDTRLREYVDALNVSERTKRDRVTQLRFIRRIYEERGAATVVPPPNTRASLSTTLRESIARLGIAPKTFAIQVGVSAATVRGWLNGGGANKRGVPSLHRVEAALGLERDSLVKLAVRGSAAMTGRAAKKDREAQPAAPVISHRRRIAECIPHGFILAESELGDEFLCEWYRLFSYKTGGMPELERTSKGVWRLIPEGTFNNISSLARRKNMVCPSAEMLLDSLRKFLGVLFRLPVQEGGIHWRSKPAQTLAWLAHPDALALYLQWMTDRSDGIRHSGQRVFAQFVACLLRPNTGYLWQQPEVFRERLPLEMRPADAAAWQTMCARSHAYLRQVVRSAKGVSRAPDEPIADLLSLPYPLKPVLEALKRIDAAAAACPPGSMSEARHKRNALLLALLLSNPLRRRSIASLTWLSDGHGSLRRTSENGWRIVLAPHQLKNGDSKRGKSYNVKVADWVAPRLSEYVEEYRDTLLDGKESPYLFVAGKSVRLWEGLGPTVQAVTQKYIPGSAGFGPHALRHLVATDWLRRYPGDFLTVAELLNDRLETVLASYAHLKRDDSFSRYEAHVSMMMNS